MSIRELVHRNQHNSMVLTIAITVIVTVCITQFLQPRITRAEEPSPITLEDTQAGPLYDLPEGVSSVTVCDRATNTEYILVVQDGKVVGITPSLDTDGRPQVMERD